ncbi:serine hydrolase [Nesterenkonia ebinurensis]|uniref:serine hydrolase n=1 Tax=Nesterenkonia ebinurensis TaxID=2608252 RepID=UPI00123E25FC|nr:serine hydrolase [Nesterenkonia ebinurensis]
MRRLTLAVLLAATLSLGAAAPLVADAEAETDAELQQALEDEVARAEVQGVNVSVGVQDLTDPDADPLLFNAGETYHGASTVKVAVLIALLRQVDAGVISLDAPVTVPPELSLPGTGDLDQGPLPLNSTVAELAHLMITESDNTAQHTLVYYIGLDPIEQLFADLGAEHLWYTRVADSQNPAVTEAENIAEVEELLALLTAAYTDEDLLSEESREFLLETLLDQRISTKFGQIPAQEGTLAHKTGEIDNHTHDIGYFLVPGREHAVVVLTEVTTTWDFTEMAAIGNPVVTDIGQVVYDHLESLPEPQEENNDAVPEPEDPTLTEEPDPTAEAEAEGRDEVPSAPAEAEGTDDAAPPASDPDRAEPAGWSTSALLLAAAAGAAAASLITFLLTRRPSSQQ